MKTGILLASLCASSSVSAWTNHQHQSSVSRRSFLDTAGKLLPLVVVSSPAFAEEETAAAPPLEETPPPPSPVVTEENEFIARLKAQSEANKDKYKRMAESNDKLSNRQFSSQYDRPKYVGVHTKDNESVKMVLQQELDGLLDSGSVI